MSKERQRESVLQIFWWKSVDSTKNRLWIWWMSDTESFANKEKNWNRPFYRPIESSLFHFLTLAHFCIPRKKRSKHSWTFYLFAWCLSFFSSFDSLVYSLGLFFFSVQRRGHYVIAVHVCTMSLYSHDMTLLCSVLFLVHNILLRGSSSNDDDDAFLRSAFI